uniref:THO complex subunit 2 n=1 Tax=Mycena chlorophos TaxID=658473 RepID=A0ABQ0LS37_MYCCL|nr:predicted protein [Mycena chlorophos]
MGETVVAVRRHIETWAAGGKDACRALVVPAYSDPDPAALDTLETVYTVLLDALLATWSPTYFLPLPSFVSFVKSVVDALPSSSSSPSPAAFALGEQLVDAISQLDSLLEEIVLDAKTAMSNCGENPRGQLATTFAHARKAKQTAEVDKGVLVQVMKRLLELGIVPISHVAERLDTAVASSVGIIPEKVSFDKKEIRTRTGLFYKQNKFNLLREQSEGYSKLAAELTSSLGPAHAAATGLPTETYASIHERARPVWEKVISLVGYFDLDPNRALDIILDVLSVHLVSHYSFFLALLSYSPWAASYRRPSDANMPVDPPPTSLYKGKTLDEVLSLAHPEPSQVSVNAPPRVMAQVVGFKFAYYQSPDVPESTPRNLYLTAAILIREGFITLEDLYPHLSPSDDKMDEFHQQYLADVETRMVVSKRNALTDAPALTQDERPSASAPKAKTATSAPEAKKTADPKKLPNQKVGLLGALLAVGAMKPAVAILSKFPWFIDAHPEIADLMLRILKYSIAPLYDAHLVPKGRSPGFSQPRARYGNTGVTLPPPRKPILTLWAPTPPCTSTHDFVFFFPNWTERVPVCSTLDDLVDVIEPLVAFVGPQVSRDTLFFTKLLRLGKVHVQTTVPEADPKKAPGPVDPDDPIRHFWFNMLRKLLLPALSLVRGSSICMREVWNILRYFETTSRWRLYGEWRWTTYQSHPELRLRHAQVQSESNDVMRRLSLKTFDALSGTVAKLVHANPCIFFKTAVSQIMSYDNMASPVIHALRYVTNMGFDVLAFVVLDFLANPDKERVKPDGVNTSDWLQSLASFTGMLFQRYNADLTPVLKYIVNQLHNGQTTEIVVLRELIWKMAGIEPLPSLSDNQIVCMAGGPILRIEAIASSARGARLDPAEAIFKGPYRLGRTLLDSTLAFPLLVQVAQQRDSCVYKAPDAHLKSIAGLFDTTHGVLLQYIELLTSSSAIAPKDYAEKVLPPLGDLGELYGISAPIAMHIIRPVLNAKLLVAAEALQEQEKIANTEAEKRLKAALTAKKPQGSSRVASPGPGASTPDTSEAKASPPQDAGPKEDVLMEPALAAASVEGPWLPELQPLFEDVKRIAPAPAYEIVGPAFYLTFWQMSTYDIAPPHLKYEEQTKILKDLSAAEDSRYNQADRSPDRAIRATAASHRHRRDRYNQFLSSLTQDLKQQTAFRSFTLKRLTREKPHWFSHCQQQKSVVMGAILEHCIQPRALLSPMDADYCAQIIKILHTMGTPGFSTIVCYDKVLSDQIRAVLFSCSEYEARNYGLFLRGVLSDLFKWYSDEALYIADNQAVIRGTVSYHPGFVQKQQNKKFIQQSDIPPWESNFKRLVQKWHKRLARGFIDSINTGEFMRIYNSIVMLKEILPVFPLAAVVSETGTSLVQTMETFVQNEQRDNLKILGTSYLQQLNKRESYWSKAPAKSAVKTSSAASSEKAKTPSAPGGSSSRASTSAPSAPRAQLATSTPPPEKPAPATPQTTSAFGANIQKPPVIKRVHNTSGTGDDKSTSSRYNSPSAAATPPVASQDGHPMPPPAAPSQTQSAQELRETAKQSMGKKDDDKRTQNGSRASSPRRRSPSPSSRPGTRNHSSERRANRESAGEDKPRTEHASALTRRDSLTHRARDRDERDKDRRHERDRRDDRERDPRDRDRHARKEAPIRSVQTQSSSSTPVAEDKSTPGRSEPRPRNGEDTLGKRRRTSDDEPERGSKRASRREGSYREERSRRPGDKDVHDRGGREQPDRRRRDESDSAGSSKQPISAPSGPRAMSTSDSGRLATNASTSNEASGSLQSRLSERRDDDRDSRKRPSPSVEGDGDGEPSKRAKPTVINRHRYREGGASSGGGSEYAKRTLQNQMDRGKGRD